LPYGSVIRMQITQRNPGTARNWRAEMANKKMTFMQACKDFFGLHNGQTTMEFAKEIKALTDDDRKEIRAGLEQSGYEILQAA